MERKLRAGHWLTLKGIKLSIGKTHVCRKDKVWPVRKKSSLHTYFHIMGSMYLLHPDFLFSILDDFLLS